MKARALKINAIQRHIFLCCGESTAASTAAAGGVGELKMVVGSKQVGGNVCCSEEQGAESWEYLKKRSRELNVKHHPFQIGRTKVSMRRQLFAWLCVGVCLWVCIYGCAT